MQAMIFAAGLGTRLRPLTDNRPKALVEVAGKKMLERVVTRLVGYGVTQIVVNVHHFGEQIIDFLNNNDFGAPILISDERDHLLDTGGGLVKAMPLFNDDEPLLLYNADILSDFDIGKMLAFHCQTHADSTILVADRPTSRYFLFDDDCRLRGWTNVSTGEVIPESISSCVLTLKRLAFGGVHILSPSIFSHLMMYSRDLPDSVSGKFSITPFYVALCDTLNIRGYVPGERYTWFDVGKIESLRQAEAQLSRT